MNDCRRITFVEKGLRIYLEVFRDYINTKLCKSYKGENNIRGVK